MRKWLQHHGVDPSGSKRKSRTINDLYEDIKHVLDALSKNKMPKQIDHSKFRAFIEAGDADVQPQTYCAVEDAQQVRKYAFDFVHSKNAQPIVIQLSKSHGAWSEALIVKLAVWKTFSPLANYKKHCQEYKQINNSYLTYAAKFTLKMTPGLTITLGKTYPLRFVEHDFKTALA